jgi:hypothetical protein
MSVILATPDAFVVSIVAVVVVVLQLCFCCPVLSGTRTAHLVPDTIEVVTPATANVFAPRHPADSRQVERRRPNGINFSVDIRRKMRPATAARSLPRSPTDRDRAASKRVGGIQTAGSSVDNILH